MSTRDHIAAQQQAVQELIIHLTGISQDELSAMTFDTAYVYLTGILETDAHGLEIIPQTPNFWAWWRSEWCRLDQQFIDLYGRYACNLTAEQLRDYYLQTHAASRDNFILDEDLLRVSFHQYIKSIVSI